MVADLIDKKDKQIADLLEALEMASKYLAKASAENLMEGCIISPRKALESIEQTIKRAKGE